ncbi:hypothetical protein EI555_021439, partial [Monodon monoceros]
SGFGDLKGTWSRLLLCLSPAGTGGLASRGLLCPAVSLHWLSQATGKLVGVVEPPSNLTDMVQFQGTAPENRHLDTQGRQPELTRRLWIHADGGPILPFEAQYPILQYIHELTHWNP